MQSVGKNARVTLGGEANYYSPSSVPEKYSYVATCKGKVQSCGVNLSTDNEYTFVLAGLDQTVGQGKTVNKARALSADV
jgi:hypothetical protein